MRTLRRLFKRPGYALASIAILALTIGANTAVFTILYAVALRPLPYPDANRLVFAYKNVRFFEGFGERMPATRADYTEWRNERGLFETTAAFTEKQLKDARPAQPEIAGLFATPEMFPLLDARPQLGRLFRADDDRAGAEPVVVLSDAFFETRYQRDAAAVGQSIQLGGQLDGASYRIIGVLPRRFRFPRYGEGENQPSPDVLLPLSRVWGQPDDDTRMSLTVMAKLAPGVTIETARTGLGALEDRLFKAAPERHLSGEVNVFSFAQENTSNDLNRTLYLLLGSVAFLLLIGCANLANLTLARAGQRSREIAVRRALGASRAAIVRQLLGESFAVSMLGAGAGLVLASLAIPAILSFEPPGLDRPEQVEVNLAVFAFTAAAAALAALLFGLVPALLASRTSVNAALKTGGVAGASAARKRGRQALIAFEVATALVLLTGAGLTIRSLVNVIQTGIGIDTERFISADVPLPEDRYADAAARRRFFEQWLDRARAIPGVEAATVSDTLPLHAISAGSFEIAGRPLPDPNTPITSDAANVGPEYFRTMRIQLLAGRDFEEADLDRDPKQGTGVVIVNQAFANQFFPDASPVGQRLTADDGKQTWEIVGVAANFRATGAETAPRTQRFYPSRSFQNGILIARTPLNPASLAAPIRAALAEVDPQVRAAEVETMRHYVLGWLAPRLFLTGLLGVFATMALALAMTGVYSVLTSLVSLRTREIGIRMALGASPGRVGQMVAFESLRPIVAGLALGLGGSLALARVLASSMNLFEVGANDPLTLTGAAVALLLAAPLAVYVPLRRATRVECTVALREE